MRYRLMATYRGVPYEAGVGPSNGDVVLFAACPPPEGLGFGPATGHWRKQVIRAEVDALWESRPVGIFGGEPCTVLDDLGDRLHITYLGMDAERAVHLGYWQVDRGVFELLAPRGDVTGLAEERVDRPLHWNPPATGDAAQPAYPYGAAPGPAPEAPTPEAPTPHAPDGLSLPVVPPEGLPPAITQDATGSATGSLLRGTTARAAPVAGGRAARRERVPTREIFCELADLAGIPRSAYAIETEADGAFCLESGGQEFQVFLASAGARHEMRSFADEEAAFFYLFGVLAAEAVRNGALVPGGATVLPARQAG